MTPTLTATEPTYWIAHSPDGIIHQGFLDTGQHMATGLENVETYTSPKTQRERIKALEADYPAALAEWLETERLRDPYAHLADYRWKQETGGVTLTSGVEVHTDDRSQGKIVSTMFALTAGLTTAPIGWKAKTGFVSLSQAEFTALATEVTAHVAKCFAAEEAVKAQLDADPTIDVEASFDAAYAAL